MHQHSGWLIPLGFLLAIVALSGLFLAWYLRPVPGAFRDSRPTAAATRVVVTVRGVRLNIPANYLEGRSAKGGDVDVLALFALLPDMRGYSNADSALFTGNAADSAVVHLLVRADTLNLDSATRFERIYKPYLVNAQGTAGPFGLTRYDFRPDSGYGRDDLFVGSDGAHRPLLLRCERPAQDISSPNCLAIDRPIAHNVNLSYRFKRAQLARWQEISNGVGGLVAGFVKP